MADNAWQFWVDRGGTFTDVIGLTPTGSTIIQKLLSVDEQRYADAAVEGICRILNQQDFPQQIDAIRIGTTAATNALLERGGSPTALITTRGFADALLIGYQTRPNIFALDIQLPKPLYSTVIEADERVDANGNILTELDRDSIRLGMQELQAQGIQSIAVCFMHAYRFNDHERQVAQIATDLGFEQISMSHEVGPLVKLVSRGDTTVVDAYLSPMLQQYVRQFQRELGKAHSECDQILFMQSNGGLVQAGRFRGKDSVLSGPAGGVVGMVARGQHAGLQQLIGFDMGGTSTDVSLFSETYEFVNHTEIAGVKLRSPMLRVHTIAAGGSSILAFEAGRFQVGPKSAAADPGPAGYRRGGPLTLTDANVLLVWLFCGLLALTGALSLSELGAMMPRSGGCYAYNRHLYGETAGYLTGVLSWLLAFVGALAYVTLLLGHHVGELLKPCDLIFPPAASASIVIVILSAIHCLGLREGNRANNAFTVFKVAVILAFIMAGFSVPAHAELNTTINTNTILSAPFAAAMISASFAYLGWETATWIAGDLRDPQKSLPRSLIVGTAFVTGLYLLLNIVFLRAKSVTTMEEKIDGIGLHAAEILFSGNVSTWFNCMIIAVLLSTTSCSIRLP